MAKTAKLKKTAKSSSLHSRAARRATSPTLNIDKSLTRLPPPSTSILSARPGSGISKKGKGKGKGVSRQQRLRKEKGLERAEAVIGKRERKVERSLGKEVEGRERGVPWEDLNGRISGVGKTKGKRRVEVGKEEGGGKDKLDVGNEEEEWMDEDVDISSGKVAETKDAEEVAAAAALEVVLQTAEGDKAPPDPNGDGDGIIEDEVL